jgi:predicted dehydrogenase
MGSWDPAKFNVEDSAFGFIRFKNGASLMLESSFALNIKDRSLMNVNLFGEKAGATVFPPVIYSEKRGTKDY